MIICNIVRIYKDLCILSGLGDTKFSKLDIKLIMLRGKAPNYQKLLDAVPSFNNKRNENFTWDQWFYFLEDSKLGVTASSNPNYVSMG